MEMVKVTNRDSGAVGYSVPELGVNRTFATSESKRVPLEEIKKLSFLEGGDFILKNLLIVEKVEEIDELNMKVEPEYYYTEDTIRELLATGSIEQLEDALTFGKEHEGVIELIKSIAVETELSDTRKRDLITEKTGFNINNAIMVNKIMDAEVDEENKEEAPAQRKAAPITAERKAEPVRKAEPAKSTTTGSKYTVKK